MQLSASSTIPYLPEQFTRRLLRSLNDSLRRLHRSDSKFFILGATGNVYTVTLSAAPNCTCPDLTTPCKHIFFVYFRVLSLSLDDPCARRQTLRPCQLTRLLSTPVSDESFAVERIRRRFHELYRRRNAKLMVSVEEGSTCPVCLEEMGVGGERVVACGACKNPIHEDCLRAWKKKGSKTCVICRARWKEVGKVKEDGYINLSAYVSEDDDDITAHVNQQEENCGDYS